MPENVENENADIGFFNTSDLLQIALRFWKLILVFVVLGAAGGYLVSRYLIKPTYEATADLFVGVGRTFESPSVPEGGNVSAEQNFLAQLRLGGALVNDYQAFLSSRRLRRMVDARLDAMHPKPRPEYQLVPFLPQRTQTLKLVARSSDPILVRDAANIASEEFLSMAKDILRLDNVKIYDPAEVPTIRIAPSHKRNLVLGAVVGLLFGCCVAFLMDFLDHTLKSPEAVRSRLRREVLGTMPLYTEGESTLARELGVRTQNGLISLTDTHIGEACRLLRTNLPYLVPARSGEARIFMLTSTTAAEGKSTCLANLAVITAQADHRVLLIDCDLRKPSMHRIFDVNRGSGLVDVLVGDRTFEDAVLRNVAELGVDLLLAGPQPPNPSELLGGERFRELLQRLRKEYDYIFLDTPPCLMMADPLILSRLADAVIYVVASGGPRLEGVRNALTQLDQAGARVSGILLNKFDFRNAGYSYHNYYNYSSYYGSYDTYGAQDRGTKRD